MKKIIKETIEYQAYRKGLIMLFLGFIGLFTIMCIPFLILYIQNGDKRFLNSFVIFSIIDLVLFIPFIVYYFFRMIHMIKIGSKMKLAEVELNDFESTIYGLMVFYISIPNCNGEIMKKRSLCSIRGRLFNEYKNTKVKICYLDDYKYFLIAKH